MGGDNDFVGANKHLTLRYQLSLLRISKNETKRLISSFVDCTEKLRKAIPVSVYNQIILTDNNVKIAALRKFVKTKTK